MTLRKPNFKTALKRIKQRGAGLYKLTPEDVKNIEEALRFVVIAHENNNEFKEAVKWKRTWKKFSK